MKTETRIYDDGTEPDVIKRWCCDNRCMQGRYCPDLAPAPAPAEACTELGYEDVAYTSAVEYLLLVAAAVAAIFGVIYIMGCYA